MRGASGPVVGALLSLTLLVGSACGSNEAQPAESTAMTSLPTVPPTTKPPVTQRSDTEPDTTGGYLHSAEPDDVVMSFGGSGGFVSGAIAYQRPPEIIVTGDLRVIQPGESTGEYPGPFVPPLTERAISESGVQRLVAAADEAGLLRDVTYTSSRQIADAETTTVVLGVGDESRIHEVYALGFYGVEGTDLDAQSIAAHEALASFTSRLGDLSEVVGVDALGPTSAYRPDAYLITARSLGPPGATTAAGDEQPVLVDWPASASVHLADASSCVEVDGDAVADGFESATTSVVFVEDGVQYSVLAKQAWPGAAC
jgi:hypothetical protein